MLFNKTKYDIYYCNIETLGIEVVIDNYFLVKIYKKNKINPLKEFGPFPTNQLLIALDALRQAHERKAVTA